MSDNRNASIDILFLDVEYQDLLVMERTCIREFVGPEQAVVLYSLWSNVDRQEIAYREAMYPDMHDNNDPFKEDDDADTD